MRQLFVTCNFAPCNQSFLKSCPLRVPEGLEDVSKVPNLVAELVRRGWTDEEVKAALGNNLLRVMGEVEKVRRERAASGFCGTFR